MSTIIANGLGELEDYFKRLPEISTEAARIAINDVAAGSGLKLLRAAAYEEVNFPAGYLNNERLGLAQRATNSNLEAVIKGRDRATSLARFREKGQGVIASRGKSIRVTVKPGDEKTVKNSWLVNLNNGNIGLAVRVKEGRQLNKTQPSKVRLAPDVFLLYGPSVDQVFAGVAADNEGAIGDQVVDEFLRQLERLSRE